MFGKGPVTPSRVGQLAVPAGVVAIVVMMVVPLPTALLDILIAANITGALLVLLVSMFVRRPLDFAIFPSLLLVATLFRLALNISATRLVLLDGYAGKVIEAFGHFVIGGSLIVGLVIFLILIVIQFVVITNGAGRVAEVGARFTLDAMPGKQMAIDADLNAGLIDENEARQRRIDVAAEADFYGAMDGGSKFVKGDAIAAIVITVINLLGGFLVGVMQRGMPFSEAVQTYSLLTVGDGLVSQIPALLLSVSTGLIVTRSATEGDMGSDVIKQFAAQHKAMRLGGFAVLGLCLIPGLPKLPFLLTGGSVLIFSSRMAARMAEEEESKVPVAAVVPDRDDPESIVEEMRVDAIALEVAYDVVDLVDPNAGGDLLSRVKALRRKLALELGLVLPPVRTRDDIELPMSTYRIRLHGVEVARGQAPPGCMLAIGEGLDALPGQATSEPVFGLAAKWIVEGLRHQAELSGATVVDRASVITTHLSEVVRDHASRLLGREDVRMLVDAVKRTHPVVVEELTPSLLTLGEVQKVLQTLLEERAPVRDLVRIFEAMSQRARTSTDTEGLVEASRAALGPALCVPHASDGVLHVMTLAPMLEQSLLESVRGGDSGTFLLYDAERLAGIVGEAGRLMVAAQETGRMPVLVCAPQIRAALRRIVKTELPALPVISYTELGGSLQIQTIGTVDLAHTTAA